MKTIVACLDFSDVTEAVVQAAGDLAKGLAVRLVLLHSVPIQLPMVAPLGADAGLAAAPAQDVEADKRHADARLGAFEDRLRGQGIDAARAVSIGAGAGEVLAAANTFAPDLIVVGSHGHGALHHLLLGSTTQHMVRHATCPVVVVPSGRGGGGPR